MNILVLGSGGREHTLTWACVKSPLTDRVYVAPGNGGTNLIATNIEDLDITDGDKVVSFAKQHDIGLVVIGPEAPLVAGVADYCRAAGIPVFGPDKQGSQLEGSKTFSKQFMIRNDIPTARYSSFDNKEDALTYLEEVGAPVVVKADGLAAGKGVVVADEIEEAQRAINDCFDGSFGLAGSRVVIEECLVGPECSLLAFVSDGKAHCMVTAQDHKRAFNGDSGPNTGGMGAYSPVPVVNSDELNSMRSIMERAAMATAQEFEHDYRGVLYGGFMLTEDGPKMLEFNARFGDPETQVVLPRLKSDLVEIMLAVAEGRPDDINLVWDSQWACGVVLASEGYPRKYETGKVILGVAEAEEIDDVHVFHAGTTTNQDGELLTAGGRVLTVVALGVTFEEARERAYRACDAIKYEGKQYRTDIGEQAAAECSVGD